MRARRSAPLVRIEDLVLFPQVDADIRARNVLDANMDEEVDAAARVLVERAFDGHRHERAARDLLPRRRSPGRLRLGRARTCGDDREESAALHEGRIRTTLWVDPYRVEGC